MQRLFPGHHLRRQIELSPLWTLTTLDEGGLDHPVQAVVPCMWESIPGLRAYKGRAAYENTFEAGGTLRFVFGGVSFRARAYLDGKEIAAHYGAFTAFDAVVENVPHGVHTLRIVADNRYGEDSALHVENMIRRAAQNGGAGKPVLISEIGAGAICGNHDPAMPKWSEERQAEIVRRQIDAVLGHPACSGSFLWQFADTRVDESWAEKRPGCLNNKGVVDRYRQPKLAYAAVKEAFAGY